MRLISLIRPIRHIRPKILFEVLGAIVIASVIIGLFAYFSPKAAEAAWKDDNWHFRKKLVIDAAQVSDADTADFTNFPVLVSIDNDSSLKSNAQSDGDDILFTSSDGTTQLDHEIESYTSDTGTLRAWVEIPTLDYNDDTTIYIYYGNSSAASQQNATGTWNSNYVGVWHLNNGNYNNSTSITNLNGTAYNSPGNLTSAKVAGGLSFSSSTSDNDYIEIANNSNLNSANALTVEAWVNLRSFSNNEMAVGYESSSNQTGYGLWATSGDFRFWVSDGTGFGGTQGTTPGTPTTNTWYHLVGVYNGSTVTAYLNSTAGTPVSYTGGISANTTTPLRFGIRAQDSPGQYNDLDGSIDEIRISNTQRSAGWIATEYNNQNSPSTFFKSVGKEEKSKEPVLYLKFDEGQGTTANDSSPNKLNGTISGAAWKEESLCISGKCLYIDGSDDNISKADDDKLDFGTGSFSVSTWVKRNGISSANNVILTKSTANLGATYTGYKLYMDSSGDLCFDTQDGTNAVDTACTSLVDFDDNQWHYVTGVKTTTTSLTLYVDGKSRATDSSIASTATLSNSSIFYVGVDSDGLATEWLGFIDEVKVYDFALSSAQVQANFASRGSVKGVSAQMGGADMEWLSEGLVGYWKLDESSWNGTANEVVDSSGNGNHGTSSCTGGGCTVPSTTIGKFSNGGNFDGTEDDYIDAGSPSVFDNMTKKTVSMWIKRTNITSSRSLLSKNATSGAGSWIIQMRGNGQSAGPNTVRYNHGYSTLAGIWYSSTLLTDTSAWYHIAVSYDESSSSNAPKIYVNGKQETVTRSQAPSGTEGDDSAYPVRIGSDAWAEYFQGNIDEVRIYNRILSPKEVRDLYNFAPGPRVELKMEEGSGTSANDSSGNSRTGTINGNPVWSTGKYGKGIKMDGTGDNIQVSDF